MKKFFKNKNILVAGGSGFLGTNFLTKLSKYNCNIKATYLNNRKFLRIKKIKYIKADLLNKKHCNKVCSNVDILIIASAVSSGAADIQNRPLIHLTPNLIINSLLLETAYKNKVKHVVFISSSTVYPLSKKIMTENSDNYNFFEKYFIVGWMKKFSEIICEMYATKIKDTMKCTIIRPSNIYGPHDKFDLGKAKVIPALINKIFRSKHKIEVWGDGKDIKDFIYVEDFIDATLKIITKQNKIFDIFNISQGNSITLNKVIMCLKKITNKKNLIIKYNKTKPTMIPIRKISSKKINKMWKPKHSLLSGLTKTYDWYSKQNS